MTKQKPERTPENKAMDAPENKQLKFSVPAKKKQAVKRSGKDAGSR